MNEIEKIFAQADAICTELGVSSYDEAIKILEEQNKKRGNNHA